MQILMHSAICRTEYSCGHWVGCPCSGPNAAFLLPSLFWHADKEQQGKEQGGESKVSPWQKFTPNFRTLRKQQLTWFLGNVFSYSSVAEIKWRFSCLSSLCTNCEYLTLLLTVFHVKMDFLSSVLPLTDDLWSPLPVNLGEKNSFLLLKSKYRGLDAT